MAQFFLGVVGLVAVILTLRYTARATGAAASAARASADNALAANRAARAAEDAVAVAAKTAQQELRAYLFVKNFAQLDERGPSRQSTYAAEAQPGVIIAIGIGVEWENSGNTPARNVRCCISQNVPDDTLPPDFDFPDLGEVEQTVIGPKAIFGSRRLSFNSFELTEAVKGNKKCYLWGWADYDAVIEPRTRYRTEFCFEIVIRETQSGGYYISYRPHNRFNGADDDCLHKPEPFAQA